MMVNGKPLYEIIKLLSSLIQRKPGNDGYFPLVFTYQSQAIATIGR